MNGALKSTSCEWKLTALIHIYQVNNVWLFAMSGDSFEAIIATIQQITEEAKAKSIEEIKTLFFQLSERFKAFFHRQEDLEAVTSFQHPRFGTLNSRYSDIVQHIVIGIIYFSGCALFCWGARFMCLRINGFGDSIELLAMGAFFICQMLSATHLGLYCDDHHPLKCQKLLSIFHNIV